MSHAEPTTCAAQSVIDLKVDAEIPRCLLQGNPRSTRGTADHGTEIGVLLEFVSLNKGRQCLRPCTWKIADLASARMTKPFSACPLRSKSGQANACPSMSALCHVWTAPSWQGLSSRLQVGRCSHVF